MRLVIQVPCLNEEATKFRNVRCISNGYNRGIAHGCQRGIDEGLRRGAVIIVNIDGDNQHDPRSIPDLIAPILAGAGMALAMLSYATVTFRYRAEFWPLVFALVMVSFPSLLARVPSVTSANVPRVMMILTAVGLFTGITTAARYSNMHRNAEEAYFLDRAQCLQVLSDRFLPADRSRLCADWSFR